MKTEGNMVEVLKLSVLSLLLCISHVAIVESGDPVIAYGKIGEEIQLECPSGKTDTSTTRAWYRGRFSETDGPDGVDMIYRGPATNTGPQHRDHMTLDEDTYTLSLKVHEDGSDNDFFTCVTESLPKKKFDVTQVLIFLQPEISIATDPKQPEAGLNVTVTCTIKRLYPNITSDQFTMKWGTNGAPEPEFSAARNDDGSMKYTLEKMKNLTWEDNGLNVKCTVRPKANFGEPASGNITLAFSKTPPTDAGPSTDGESSSTAAIVGGVIGGLAVVGLVALIIVIVLGRKKPKNNTKTKTRQSEVKNTKTKTNKPAQTEEGLMYADLDLVTQPGGSTTRQGSQPPATHRPVQEPTEYAQIDFDKLKRKMSRDEEDLDLSDVEDPKRTTG